MTNNRHNTYANNAILTASQEELTLMLYNGAIKFCNKAIYSIEQDDLEGAHGFNIRVQDIIMEFQITLNMDYEVSEGLALLYDYIMRRLIEANIKKDNEILEEVCGHLREIRDTWKQAMVLAKQKKIS
ncbi:MAG: flagellar export chaperone FliS [Vallitaleaceae bacterium]|jgi:flagellar protein FliS|nr:flagellar export chaperone FliS [Vallitaleaceae bacterium]